MRLVSDLRWAQQLDGWPDSIPRSRVRGVKALGRRYETAVAHQLGSEATRGVWWTYRDSRGPGLCQTDLIINGTSYVVILECKHTWTAEGMDQLRYLYIPVVEMATGKQALGIQVCKHLVPYHTGLVYPCLEDAVAAAKAGYKPQVTLHWRGVGPLLKHFNQKEFKYGTRSASVHTSG
jgi:hypothetical protein